MKTGFDLKDLHGLLTCEKCDGTCKSAALAFLNKLNPLRSRQYNLKSHRANGILILQRLRENPNRLRERHLENFSRVSFEFLPRIAHFQMINHYRTAFLLRKCISNGQSGTSANTARYESFFSFFDAADPSQLFTVMRATGLKRPRKNDSCLSRPRPARFVNSSKDNQLLIMKR